jgi:His/Glu/Gln/Arg/opine family amino acid ABC transporter permease subunit
MNLARTQELLEEWLPQLLVAAGGTLRITAGAFVLASLMGLLLAFGQLSRRGWLARASLVYIETIRGVPALTLLFLLYFALASGGIVMQAFQAAVVGLGLNGAAYLAEVYRAGIQSIHAGQREAAQSVGMNWAQTMRYIIMPQAMRVVIPPLVNYLIALLKETSIASLIAAPELTNRARDLSSEYFMPMQLYLLTGLMYFLMAYPLSRAARFLEARMTRTSTID